MEYFYVYILKCSDGALYVGHTDNIEQRLADHNNKTFGGYTSKRLPVTLVYLEAFQSREEAFVCERRLKGWTRKKKEAFIKQNWQAITKLARKNFVDKNVTKNSAEPFDTIPSGNHSQPLHRASAGTAE